MTTTEVLRWAGAALLGWTVLSVVCALPVALWFRSRALENERAWQGSQGESALTEAQTRLA